MYNKHESKSILHSKWIKSEASYIIKRKIEARDKLNEKVNLTINDRELIPLT